MAGLLDGQSTQLVSPRTALLCSFAERSAERDETKGLGPITAKICEAYDLYKKLSLQATYESWSSNQFPEHHLYAVWRSLLCGIGELGDENHKKSFESSIAIQLEPILTTLKTWYSSCSSNLLSATLVWAAEGKYNALYVPSDVSEAVIEKRYSTLSTILRLVLCMVSDHLTRAWLYDLYTNSSGSQCQEDLWAIWTGLFHLQLPLLERNDDDLNLSFATLLCLADYAHTKGKPPPSQSRILQALTELRSGNSQNVTEETVRVLHDKWDWDGQVKRQCEFVRCLPTEIHKIYQELCEKLTRTIEVVISRMTHPPSSEKIALLKRRLKEYSNEK